MYPNTLHPFLQWNCRGYYANYEELLLLIRLHQPYILCLQELHLRHRTLFSPPHFAPPLISTSPDSHDRTGTALIIHNSLPYRTLPLHTNLQAVAAQIHFPIPLTVCSLYLPPSIPYTEQDLSSLFQQLPPPVLITGDFNMRHPLWGDATTSPTAELLISLLDKFHLSILNTGIHTYERFRPYYTSCIDITLCSISILTTFSWTQLNYLHGSDHFPTLTSSTTQLPHIPSPSHWNYHKADWSAFTSDTPIAVFPFHPSLQTTDDAYTLYKDTLLTAAQSHIPKTTPAKLQTPWWTPSCTIAHKHKQRQYNIFKRSPTTHNLILYKTTSARCRRLLRQARRTYFRNYVSFITSDTPLHQVYKTTYALNHHHSFRPALLQYGPDPQDYLTAPGPIADTFGYTFASNSNSQQYSSAFQHIRNTTPTPTFTTPSSSTKSYNSLFTRQEYLTALHNTKDGAPGPDGISLQMIIHAHPLAHAFFLDLINRIWFTSQLPLLWTTAIVIPIPKPGKDHTLPQHHRPISLTSIPSKVMERMVINRLQPLLTSLNALSPQQYGFKKHFSTIDPLLKLDHDIRLSFHRKQHTLAAFLDLTRAYDSTWRTGILLKLFSLGFRGQLPQYIQALLSNRYMTVKYHNTLSRFFYLEEGVPQGGVLSGLLFNLAINDISTTIPPTVHFSLYADDLLLYTSGPSIICLERQLQITLNSCSHWTATHGFTFSPSKSAILLFTKQWSRRPRTFTSPQLHLQNSPIPYLTQHRFLGITLDSHLTYKPHILTLRAHCQKLLDLLQHIAGKSWGVNRQSLLHLYLTLIRSKLSYACEVYGQSAPSSLLPLLPIQNRALRIATGAFRSTPIPGLHLFTSIFPLPLYITYRMTRTYYRLLSRPDSPLTPILQTVSNPPPFWPFAGQVYNALHAIQLPIHAVLPLSPPSVPSPWTYPPPSICLYLTNFPKHITLSHLLRSLFLEHVHAHHRTTHIYTDGSKTHDAVGAAAVFPTHIYSIQLFSFSSNFTAELTAIILALHVILFHTTDITFTIFSDSLSSLQAIQRPPNSHPLLTTIQSYLFRIHTKHKTVNFCWVPAHVRIPGNERADALARASSHQPIPPPTLPPLLPTISAPYSDYTPYLTQGCYTEWQRHWSSDLFHPTLHHIFPTIPHAAPTPLAARLHDVIRTRILLGHTALTHGHLMSRSPPPPCSRCHSPPPLTLFHYLFECPALHLQRTRYFSSTQLDTPFNTLRDTLTSATTSSRFILFLMNTNLLHSI